MSLNIKGKGILVGRPGQGKYTYNWGIIPQTEDIDMLETNLPSEIMDQEYIVNSGASRILLKHLIEVEYVREDLPSLKRGGFLAIANISKIIRKIPLNEIDEEKIKEFDPKAFTQEYKDPPQLDAKFILSLHNITGAGTKLIKRFYSTQTLIPIKSGETVTNILIPFKEVFGFLQEENEGLISKLLVLPTFHLAIIILKPIPEEVFKEEILPNVTNSIRMFETTFEHLGGGEEE